METTQSLLSSLASTLPCCSYPSNCGHHGRISTWYQSLGQSCHGLTQLWRRKEVSCLWNLLKAPLKDLPCVLGEGKEVRMISICQVRRKDGRRRKQGDWRESNLSSSSKREESRMFTVKSGNSDQFSGKVESWLRSEWYKSFEDYCRAAYGRLCMG